MPKKLTIVSEQASSKRGEQHSLADKLELELDHAVTVSYPSLLHMLFCPPSVSVFVLFWTTLLPFTLLG